MNVLFMRPIPPIPPHIPHPFPERRCQDCGRAIVRLRDETGPRLLVDTSLAEETWKRSTAKTPDDHTPRTPSEGGSPRGICRWFLE